MKQRICEILGVELNEEFEFYGVDFRVKQLYSPEEPDGWRLEKKSSDGSWSRDINIDIFTEMMKYPERIVRRRHEAESRWTAKDYSDAELVKGLLRDATYVRRSKSGFEIQLFNYYGARLCSFYAATELFPSLAPNEKVKLDEILGGVRNEKH